MTKTGVILLVLYFTLSCAQNNNEWQFSAENKKKWEDKISPDFPTDSIRILLDRSMASQDEVAISVLCIELGRRLRESSDFSNAITYHQQGLAAAYNINDTTGITEALNSLGTDFRRIGAFPEASGYHYQALQMAEVYSGRYEYRGRKNRVMALNGIGIIHLSFGNYDEAERLFREALAEEKALNSPVGQAMNWANIGTIFQEKQMYDSAFVYYQHSMEQNLIAKSQLGIGLCHIHFGHIYELQEQYDEAECEYQQAYEIMGDISDTWHWLEACLAIARIRLAKNDFAESKKFIDLAKEAASNIQSPQHLSETYDLLHNYNQKRGNFAEALHHYKLSEAYQDTVRNMQNLNHVIDMRINYERDKNRQYIAQLNIRNEMENRQKKIILNASIIFVFLLVLLSASLFYAYIHRTKSNKILRNLSQLRTNFFTNITHEFRTPLTVILGLSKYLREQKNLTQAESNHYLKAIDRQGTHLLALVNQLLNMAKINAGMDNPEWRKGNIVVYVRMIVDSFRLYAQNNNIKLSLSSSEPVIEMDFIPHYIDDILQNLLSNALKFSPPGSEISVSVSSVKNKEISLTITDTGEGIPEEEIERIFDLFYQGGQSDKKMGSGIGLSYTRQLVEIMHGKIAVESKVKRGSTFTVKLPLNQSIEKILPTWNPGHETKSYPPETSRTMRKDDQLFVQDEKELIRTDTHTNILLIEDNEDVTLYIRALLSPQYNTATARDGVEGLKLATELVPDIIISDIMMPNKDGLTFCNEIRESELLNHIPVILLTAKSGMDDQLKGLKQGADAYIRKPFHPDELLIQIETLLEKRRLLKKKYMRSIFKKDEAPVKDINMEFLQKATDIIYLEMRNPHFSTVSLAEKLCISPSQLNRKLSAVSGYTASLYINNLRIDYAKKKLISENKSVAEIAAECGFYDIAYFSRIFKKYTNVTPSQYRRLPR
ncbi:MAG: hypothetical protein BGO34_16365 [Bacteroidia bacterium 44-10]|nr:MAG: hypothetical protein BGO34_16365 [Bacteroidia bacterium 44-10]